MRTGGENAARSRSRRWADWMVGAQAGDREAYRAVLEDIGPLLLGWLRRWLADSADLADVYQDTLVHLHRPATPTIPHGRWSAGSSQSHVTAPPTTRIAGGSGRG